MLKLEKIAKTMEISITLRHRDSFFSPALMTAFAIAIALHLVAGILFEVRPFKIKGSQIVFPPALVDVDISLSPENSVVALVVDEDIIPRSIKEPKGANLTLPSMPLTTGSFLPEIKQREFQQDA